MDEDACLDNTVSYSNETKTSLFIMQLFARMSSAKQKGEGPAFVILRENELWLRLSLFLKYMILYSDWLIVQLFVIVSLFYQVY